MCRKIWQNEEVFITLCIGKKKQNMDCFLVNLGFWKPEGIKHYKKCLRENGIKFSFKSGNVYVSKEQLRDAKRVIKKNNLYLTMI